MEPAVQRAESAISKPTTAPNGPFSSQVTGADTIEVKMTVANAQIRDALRKFDLRVDEEEKRYVYFFDTPERDLLEAGIIARARRIVGDRGTTQQSNFGRSIPVPFPGAGENSRASRLAMLPDSIGPWVVDISERLQSKKRFKLARFRQWSRTLL
ncbi:MAG: hypothetical protein WBB72_07405 [Methyloceanibacter sp.]